MTGLLCFTMALLGFVLGQNLAFPVLIIISAICLVISVFLFIRYREMAELIALAFTALAAIGNITMWIVYYVSTDQTWIGDFFKNVLLR